MLNELQQRVELALQEVGPGAANGMAHEMILNHVYHRFTEGHDTPGLAKLRLLSLARAGD